MSALSPGRRYRALVIRGDLAALGFVVAAAGLGWLNAAALGFAPGWVAAPSLAALLAGVGLIWRVRQDWRALLREVVARYRDDDPGPSPVPWISDEVWREKNAFNPALDAPTVLRAEVEPHLRAYPHDVGEAIREPVLRPVGEGEKALLAGESVGETAPPVGDAAAQRDRLAQTRGRFVVLAPRWPVCCGRLATLASLQADPSDGGVYLPTAGTAQDDPDAPIGQHTYRCRSCGRRYRTDPAW